MGIGSDLISEKNKCRPTFAIFFILSILMTQGNGFAYQQPGPSSGGAVVRNGAKGKWDDDPRIKLTFLEMLGKEDDENYMFYKPKAIASDRKGNLYVLDSGNFRVQVFDGNRKFLRSFGRKGQGPGDLGRPECLDVDAAGNVYVGDPGNGRIAIFDPAGKWLRAILIPSANIGFRVMNNGDILLQKIPLNHFCNYLKVVGDTVYILDQERLGQFYVYRIEEAPPSGQFP